MSNHTTLRTLCVKRIAPIAAALAFTLSSNPAQAASGDGRQLVENKLQDVKPGLTILKATAADLIAAVGRAIEDIQNGGNAIPGNPSVLDVAAGVLEDSGGKVRGDRDTVAPQIVTTVGLFGGLTSDQFAAAVKSIYAVNSSDAVKLQLTAKGKANTVVAALQASATQADAAKVGAAVADALGVDPDFLNQSVAISAALAKGKNTLAIGDKLEAFYAAGYLKKGLTATSAPTFAKTIAEKIAASNPEMAGVVYGGLVVAYPTAFDTKAQTDAFIPTVTGTNGKKLTKATGAILANALSRLSDADLIATATGSAGIVGSTKSIAADSLLVQGILRADVDGSLNATQVGDIVAKVGGVTDASKATVKATLAATLAVGNDGAKLTAIIDKVAGSAAVVKDLGSIGVAAINAIGVTNPDGAEDVTQALLANAGVGQAEALGLAIVPKLKTYAAGGFVVKQLVEQAGITSPALAGSLASNIMVKSKKAANDIAQQVTVALGDANAVALADAIADRNKAVVQNAAVGVSIAAPALAGDITVAAITHDGTDKAALGKAATISAAVALAADAETASLIAKAVGAKMAVTPTSDKPIKLSLVTALATGLVKSLQTKTGVDTQNRMDEIGEVAAALARAIVESGAPAAAGDKLISAVGTAIVKGLSKTAAFKSQYVFYKAGTAEAVDIAGSMSLTLKTLLETADPSRLTSLIGPTGTLTTALLKASGKTGTPVNTAVNAAIALVRDKAVTDPAVQGFEIGAVGEFNPETDTRDF